MSPDAYRGLEALPDRLEALARMLEEARRSNRQITNLPSDQVPRSDDEAYWVARVVVERLGWSPLGWKIAGTTEQVREELKLDGPIYGRSFTRFAQASPAVLELADLLDPMVECEFFVTLAANMSPRAQPYMLSDAICAIASVHAGIEVAEVRFPLSAPPPMTAVLADGSATGRYIIGAEIVDWRDGLVDVSIELAVDGITVARGCGADVMGDPLNAVVWLANERARWGDGLKAGEIISTGTATGIVPIKTGRRVCATFGVGRTVNVDFRS